MYFETKFAVVGLLLVAVLAALWLMLVSAGEGTRPSDVEMREALESELDRFRVAETVMCGVVPRGSSRADAIRCARHSISSRTPFLVAFQEQGEDSDVWSGLSGNAAGQLQAVVFDSSPYGQPQARAQYVVTSWDCLAPLFAEVGPGGVYCDNDGQR